MSLEDTERVVRQYLDALLTGGDFASFFTDDVVWTTMETGERVQGREAVRDYIVALHRQAFDAAPELVHVAFADDVAALEAVFIGKHIAEFAGVPATGTTVRLPYSVFYGVANQKIAALRAYFPVMALSRQLSQAASAHA